MTLWGLSGGEHQVDVVVGEGYRGRSEFRRLELTLEPLASQGGTPLPFAQLGPEDVDYLANKAQRAPSAIATFLHAHRLAAVGSTVPATCYFALLREGMPRSLPELLAHGPAAHHRALARAISRNVIDDPGESALASHVAALEALAIDSSLFADPGTGERSKFRAAIDAAGQDRDEGSEALQRAFLTKYAAHEGDLDSFWQSVLDDPGLGQPVHDTYRWSLQLQALTHGHQPLIDALHARRNDTTDPIESFEDLATIDIAGWTALINAGVGVPDVIPAQWDQAARVQRYAETLARLVSDAAPTAVVRARIERDVTNFDGGDDLTTFLGANPGFDLRKDIVQRYLDANTSALDAVPDVDGRREACRANVEGLQRLAYLAPRGSTYDTIKPLYLGGLRSAAQVRAMGWTAFARKFAPQLAGPGGDLSVGEVRARAIYDRAGQVHGTTLALVTKYAPAFQSPGLEGVLSQPAAPSAEAAPDLASLFGAMSYCACTHCRSVLSPAAYMVDLLQFLRNQPGATTPDALAELSIRRPDLTALLLNCANSNTTLPYIDLVIELLETRVSKGPAVGEEHWQTTWTEAELLLGPEHRDEGAYTELRNAAHPWGLPFDLHRAEAELYFDGYGLSRADVLERFSSSLDPQVRARAQLGLSRAMFEALTGAPGFSTSDSWAGKDVASLVAVPTLLEISGHSFAELEVMLRTDFVGSGLSLVLADFPNVCDLTQATISGLTEGHLERWHRFARLNAHTGWGAHTLDASLRALAPTPGSLDAEYLQRLGMAYAIARRLGLDVLTASSLWSPLDTHADPRDIDAPSTYAQLFLTQEIASFELNAEGTELADTSGGLRSAERTSTVSAALQLGQVELDALTSWLVTEGLAADATTTLAILSAARRRVVLARALGLTVTQLRHMIALLGGSPFHEASSVAALADLEATLQFIEQAREVSDSALGAEHLRYILHNDGASELGPNQDAVTNALKALDRELVGISELYALPDFTTAPRLRDALAEALAPAQPADASDRLDALMAIILGSSTVSEAEQQAMIASELGDLVDDLTTTQSALVGAQRLPTTEACMDHVLAQLLPRLEARSRRSATIQHLALLLGLPVELTQALLVVYMRAGAEPLVAAFEDGANVAEDDTLSTTSREAFERLYKAGSLVLAHDLDAAALEYLYGAAAPDPKPWLVLDELTASGPSAVNFAQWRRLAAVAKARQSFSAHPDTLSLLRDATDTAEIDVLFSERGAPLGWTPEAVTETRIALGLTNASSFDDEVALTELIESVELVSKTGVPVSRWLAWMTDEPSTSETDGMRAALRARHGEAGWASAGKQLQDSLRAMQRDALVAYLIAHGDGEHSFADEDELYAHYLLDVEMSACASTSRIKLALSSIQLFIQRVFLNLEAGLSFDADAAVQYRWMKNYRVWEANRKVFLYPENWVEPELRRDRSPLFEQLESALMQDEPTEASTERAFLDYLVGLEAIARPEVMGLVRELDAHTQGELVDRLHVLGRTRGTPHRWLYRTREDRRFWTPWVDLGVDIEGDVAVPVVFGGRLYVFWPQLRFETENIQKVTDDMAGDAGLGVVRVGLSWIERRFGTWSGIRSCAGFTLPDRVPQSRFVSFQGRLRLSTAEIISQATGSPALEIAVRQPIEFEGQPEGLVFAKLHVFGVFVLEPTAGEVRVSAIENHDIDAWSYDAATLKSSGQALSSKGGSPPDFELQTREQRWPRREQAQVIFDAPPSGFRLMFAQDEQPGLVQSTGFFYQDRWHGLFFEPRDLHRAKLGTAQDTLQVVDPGDIEAAPWLEQAGLVDTPVVVTLVEPKLDPVTPTLKFDGLQVKTKWDAGIPGVQTKQSLAQTPWAPDQLELLGAQEEKTVEETFAITPSMTAPFSTLPWEGKRFAVQLFEHPYASEFLGQTRAHGVQGLLAPHSGQGDPAFARQQLDAVLFDDQRYAPKRVEAPLARVDVDFSPGGAYSIYNWELFFHAPVLLAKRLTASQRFEEADTWLRRIFDPTASAGEAPQRFWQIRPFFDSAEPDTIHELLLLLQLDGESADQIAAREAFEDQVWRWRRRPFDPHLLASLRDGVYQRAVIMQYLDNLIAWGDSLFARDTIESINEATQLYILARTVLGPRPERISPTNDAEASSKSFAALESEGLDAFSNALVNLENYTLGSLAHANMLEQDANSGIGSQSESLPVQWYFCVPPNGELLEYWDRVEDRLTKIRCCQNLQGIERRLALFQPAIDPAALVAAAAKTGDFASALTSLSGRAPKHRFRVLVAKSLELAAEVRSLGGALLSSFEKRDANHLAKLRAVQEPAVLHRVRAVRELQIEGALSSIRALDWARTVALKRRNHFQKLLDDGLNFHEQEQTALIQQSNAANTAADDLLLVATIYGLYPDIQFGVQGAASSPVLQSSIGGTMFSRVASQRASRYQIEAAKLGSRAGAMGIIAQQQRRREDWTLQRDVAERELEQIDRQLEAAAAQHEAAKAELHAHERRIENAEAVASFMHGRYTDEELYSWMAESIQQVYKQAYNLAYRMALSAEQAYRFELQRDDSFIAYGYWDQERAGLLAGELLVQDLRRMDAAYLDNHEREYELTKVVSLARVDPYALAVLRQTGSCYFSVPEWLYDLDHPGHLSRRIKSVSVAMPAVAGPHVGGGCTLALESSRMRVNAGGDYPEGPEDARFVYRYGQVERIATSSGQDSAGLFEPSLQGPRYLPFEGAGAISTWRVDLPAEHRQFDYESIGDVLLTIRYTAREGGATQAQAAQASLSSAVAAQTYLGHQSGGQGAAMILRASVDFADAWYAFTSQEHGQSARVFSFDLEPERFPYVFAKASGLEVTGLRLVLTGDAPASMNATVTAPDGSSTPCSFNANPELNGHMSTSWAEASAQAPGTWSLSVAEADIPEGLAQSYGDPAHTRFDGEATRELLVVVFFRTQG
ncbi:hypothetical protein PPSIR1_38124 [Plesiocystis pacifica SIR-1]|uniref:Uncharacterized protein n=1 Tax=Plesiocystis pacifica SIR-1 TaxID=391625 RepID=A6GBQ4_9BACT|nr:hypothetical protein PPSIR1_38124 [Plesiocystis pacifica SIR-1]